MSRLNNELKCCVSVRVCVRIRDRQGWKNDLDTAAKLFANSAGHFYNREDTNKTPSKQDIVQLV